MPKITRTDAPSRSTSGSFSADGLWLPNEPHDDRFRFIDSLVAVRRQFHRRVPPSEFALRILSVHPHRALMFGYSPSLGISLPTLDLWSRLDRFSDWFSAPTPTCAARTVRDGGFGPAFPAHIHDLGLIPPDAPVHDPAFATLFEKLRNAP